MPEPHPQLATPTPSRLKRFSAGLTPRDMREICRTRNIIFYGGVATKIFLDNVDRIRSNYINRVGLRRYFVDILPGYIAKLPADQCTAYKPDGSSVTGPQHQRILEFLLTNFSPDNLPYRLDVRQRDRNAPGRKQKNIILAT